MGSYMEALRRELSSHFFVSRIQLLVTIPSATEDRSIVELEKMESIEFDWMGRLNGEAETVNLNDQENGGLWDMRQ